MCPTLKIGHVSLDGENRGVSTLLADADGPRKASQLALKDPSEPDHDAPTWHACPGLPLRERCRIDLKLLR